MKKPHQPNYLALSRSTILVPHEGYAICLIEKVLCVVFSPIFQRECWQEKQLFDYKRWTHVLRSVNVPVFVALCCRLDVPSRCSHCSSFFVLVLNKNCHSVSWYGRRPLSNLRVKFCRIPIAFNGSRKSWSLRVRTLQGAERQKCPAENAWRIVGDGARYPRRHRRRFRRGKLPLRIGVCGFVRLKSGYLKAPSGLYRHCCKASVRPKHLIN